MPSRLHLARRRLVPHGFSLSRHHEFAETRVLNHADSRNIRRFADDFMFELPRGEIRNISQAVICFHAWPRWRGAILCARGGGKGLPPSS